MYTPQHFAETDTQVIRDLIAAYPLATLVAQTAEGLVANHLPLLMEGDTALIGHVALNNPVHRDMAEGTPVLVIFRAEDAYISPNWYPTKAAHHRHVPTWNYQAVHLHGTLRFHHDDKFKRAVVGRLTQHFERLQSGDKAWRMADAPADYMQTMLDAIVGFRMEITRTIAKSKLSQNREPVDHASVREALTHADKTRMAQAMKRD